MFALAITCLAAADGSGVRSWWFKLRVRALHSFVALANTCVTVLLECSAKLHWYKTTTL